MGEYGKTYGLDGVLHLWEVGRLTTEQAIGQILLLVRQLDERLEKLENRADDQRARQALEGDREQ
jgi:hypothetical protein